MKLDAKKVLYQKNLWLQTLANYTASGRTGAVDTAFTLKENTLHFPLVLHSLLLCEELESVCRSVRIFDAAQHPPPTAATMGGCQGNSQHTLVSYGRNPVCELRLW